MATKKIPMRMCIGCREMKPKQQLIRVVKTPEGEIKLEAKTFIDATGDGQLAYLAGCPFTLGREPDHLCQPMTLCFRVGNADTERFMKSRDRFQKAYKESLENGEFTVPEYVVCSRPHVGGHAMKVWVMDDLPLYCASAAEMPAQPKEGVCIVATENLSIDGMAVNAGQMIYYNGEEYIIAE